MEQSVEQVNRILGLSLKRSFIACMVSKLTFDSFVVSTLKIKYAFYSLGTIALEFKLHSKPKPNIVMKVRLV